MKVKVLGNNQVRQDKQAKQRTEQQAKINKDETRVFATMLASEQVLARDWNSPEEDEAWADL